MHGTVLKYFSNYYYVQVKPDEASAPVLLECMAKSLLKKQGSLILTGDVVGLDEVNIGNKTARITEILPRASVLKKPKIANVQRVLVFVPLAQPTLDLRQLDRLLAHVHLSGLVPSVIFTKADLLPSNPISWEQLGFSGLDELLSFYTHVLGIPAVATSIIESSPYFSAVSRLSAQLQSLGGNWVLAGVSGAGKSSLLNQLNPQFNLKVGAVSDKLERGTHTTRHTELLELFPSVWVADAPGFSHLAFEAIEPEQVQQGFPEFKVVVEKTPCQFPSCLHQSEPDCAIIAAVEQGLIAKTRYLHYSELLKDVTETFESASKQSHKQEIGGVKQGNSKQGGKKSAIVRLDPKLREANRKQYNQQLNQLHETLETAAQEDRIEDEASQYID
jgi:ribosome biogenesis GTPase